MGGFWNAGPARIEFDVPLAPKQCLRRLRDAADPPWAIFGAKPVIGGAFAGRFSLRKRIWYRNSFQTCVYVSFEEVEGGTRVRCSAGMTPTTMAFLVLWFGVATLVTMSGVVTAFSRSPDLASAQQATFPLGMLAFGAVIVLSGRLFARNEKDFLFNFVHRRLEIRLGQFWMA